MKKNFTKKLVGLTLSVVMLASLMTGCSNNKSNNNASVTPAATTEKTETSTDQKATGDEVATLNILTTKISSNVTDYPDTHVTEALEKAIGVKINIIEADTDKYNVYMASGEGFDLILTPTTNFSQLIEGNVVVPMDDLMDKYGKDITANIADTVKFSKGSWSNGSGKLYFLPCQIGVDSQGIYQGMGPLTRWDYYKELGYPEIKNLDDWLKMLADMQKKHPTTKDGLPVYGVSMFTDWNVWCYKYPLACYYGYNELSGSQSGLYKPSTMEYSNLFEKDGLFWKSLEYYYKANQLGILDPDAFITKYDDFTAKASNEQLLTGPAVWAMGDFNGKHASEAVGFQVIPTSWAYQWGGTDYKAGWVDKCFGISSKCKNPEKAMEYLNYIYSYDGCRMLYSGIEGTDYTMADNKPELTQQSIDLYLNGGEEWKKSGLGFDRNITGLGNFTIDPKDGKTLDLFVDPSVYPKMLTSCQKDFSDYYKVSYPDEIFQQYRQKYSVYDQSNTDAFTVALVSSAPDDIKRKEASLVEAAVSAASKIILAGSQDEYNTLKQQTEEEFNNIGLQDVIKWYTTEWNKAKENAKQYQ
jgi:ABC-type sugar transport system, periplasmic component